jgi:hypothetical protein
LAIAFLEAQAAIGDDLPPATIANTTLIAGAPSMPPTRPPAARARATCAAMICACR